MVHELMVQFDENDNIVPEIEEVVFVHGTFAANDSDEGAAWWQKGSKFQTRLFELLPNDKFRIRIFHWSGKNTENDRRRAASRLKAELVHNENDGIPYHIIAHSHGGNVVAAALSSMEPLGLRSWVTIGTPFFHSWKQAPVLRRCSTHQ